jgi:cytochrome b involved in lipid metabolism
LMSSELKSYSKEEVSKHNSEKDLWVIINNQVYDLSKFAKVHPGGLGVLLPLAGKDCTKQFYALHQEAVLNKYGPKLLIGNLEGQKPILTQNRGELSLVPYSEPSAFTKGFSSPYYNESHRTYKLAVRDWYTKNIG